MKREIKFRAWDKNSKTMYYSFEVGVNGNLDLLDFENNIPSLELLQFTGLKDCKGKEIYEGDIIKWKNTIGRDIQDVVIWSDSSHGFSVLLTPEVCATLSGTSGKHLEVVGNIYENQIKGGV